MSKLWFSNQKQVEIMLNYLPYGRVYSQARKEGTNFNKLIKWIAFSFEHAIEKFNNKFKNLYLCHASEVLSKWKTDYNIPNELFLDSPTDEHKKDIYVLKYLMRGNTLEHFYAVADIYGIDVNIKEQDNEVLLVEYNKKTGGYDILPHEIPHILGYKFDKTFAKLNKLFDKMKEAHVHIVYKQVDGITRPNKQKFCV